MKIVYKTETGIAIITPSAKVDFDKVVEKDIPRLIDGSLTTWHPQLMTYEKYLTYPQAEYKIVEEHEIGGLDRAFRNAWNYDMKIDIPKAKEIWKEKLRRDREPLFIANDLKIRDANIDKDTSALMTAIAERDRLRNITLLVDSCKTISAIKKVVL